VLVDLGGEFVELRQLFGDGLAFGDDHLQNTGVGSLLGAMPFLAVVVRGALAPHLDHGAIALLAERCLHLMDAGGESVFGDPDFHGAS
jgi:hypothetical protein